MSNEHSVRTVSPRATATYMRRAAHDGNDYFFMAPNFLSDYRKRPTVIEHRPAAPEVQKIIKRTDTTARTRRPRKKMALLLPGHNEELILATTIKSAIAAGQKKRDIFVVDDASTDSTREIALRLLGESNVLTVERSGKALAVQKAIKQFQIVNEYQWLHVADADSIFSPDYFRIYRRKLSNDYVVAIGFVQSLRGNWISTYRAFCYTYGQHFYRRIQSALGMISVFPGPVTSFRTDILPLLELSGNNVTEDFEITLQVHRKNLGKMLFIPKAINFTQDPQTFRDFRKQSMRWYTGFFQGIQDHKIGRRAQRIDVSIGFQLLQTGFFLVQILILFPIVLIETHHWLAVPLAICIDFILTSAITVASSVVIKRWTLLGVLPYFYFLRISEIVMYFTAFVQVIILRRYRTAVKGWATEGRRYEIDPTALQDVA
jgi:cellulose synthase/poly-beta-1,6-N-acetylglucosamine synthase-like glycosyltransferase